MEGDTRRASFRGARGRRRRCGDHLPSLSMAPSPPAPPRGEAQSALSCQEPKWLPHTAPPSSARPLRRPHSRWRRERLRRRTRRAEAASNAVAGGAPRGEDGGRHHAAAGGPQACGAGRAAGRREAPGGTGRHDHHGHGLHEVRAAAERRRRRVGRGPAGLGLSSGGRSLRRGHGTYVEEEKLIASVAGAVERVNKLVCVRALKTR